MSGIASLPANTSCFVDANILYYHFVNTPPLSDPCSDMLQRVAIGEVRACVSSHVLAEAMHKIMLAEVAATFGLNRSGLVNRVREHREWIAQLQEFHAATTELAHLPLSILPVGSHTLTSAADIARHAGLLTNDAIIVALMREHGLMHLITNDDDFDVVVGISILKPR